MWLTKSEVQCSVEETDSSLPADHLNHCVVTWIVKNCGLYLYSGDIRLKSECFRLGDSSTTWKIALSTKANVLSVDLVRAENDGGLEMVTIHYKVSMKREGDSKLMRQEIESFRMEDVISMFSDTWSQDSEPTIDLDYLELTLEMFLLQANAVNTSEDISSDLKELSCDLLNLYKSGERCDIVLRANDGESMAHKAFLSYRCGYFDIIDRGVTEMVLTGFRKKILDKILRYVYSGCFELSLSDLPDIFEIQEAVNTLKPSGLEELFEAKEVTICTEAETENKVIAWEIDNYEQKSGHDDSNQIASKQVSSLKGTWSFTLCPNAESPEYIGLGVSVTDLNHELLALIVASIDAEVPQALNYTVKNHVRVCPNVKSGDKFGFPDFVLKKVDANLKNFITPEDKLKIKVNLIWGNPEMSLNTNITKRYPQCDDALPKENFNKLSDDLLKLLNKDFYSDVELKMQDQSLKAHRAILTARWRFLATLIGTEATGRKPVFTMKYVYSKVMYNVLKYVYSGKIETDNKNVIPSLGEICYLAHAYKLPKLRELCYDRFKSAVTISNVHFLLLWAQVAFVEQIEAFAYIFIKENSKDILLSENWLDSKKIYPKEIAKVESWINSGGLP